MSSRLRVASAVFSLLGAALTSVVSATPLEAQGWSLAGLEGSGIGSVSLGACSQNEYTGAGVAVSPGLDCTVFGLPGGTLIASASAIAGRVRAAVDISPMVSSTSQMLRSGYAVAGWSDRVQVGGAASSLADRVALSFWYSGRLVASVSPTGQQPSMYAISSAFAYFNGSPLSYDGHVVGQGSARTSYEPGCPPVLGVLSCSRELDVVQSHTIFVRPGDSFSVGLRVAATIGILGEEGVPMDLGGLFARSDFGHTMQLTGYRVLKANGEELTDGVDVRFEQGIKVFPTNTVPEPPMWLILGAGLLLLAGAVQFRQRA